MLMHSKVMAAQFSALVGTHTTENMCDRPDVCLSRHLIDVSRSVQAIYCVSTYLLTTRHHGKTTQSQKEIMYMYNRLD